MPEDKAKELTKQVYGLGIDVDSLLMQTEELEYEYRFNLDHYIVLAQILLQMDLNLKKTRHDLVPELITEDDFWRNYFYKIECFKRDMGLQSRLGRKISIDERAKKI